LEGVILIILLGDALGGLTRPPPHGQPPRFRDFAIPPVPWNLWPYEGGPIAIRGCHSGGGEAPESVHRLRNTIIGLDFIEK
jgi:hypothetical protein